MLLIVLPLLALWVVAGLVVVSCCLSAAQGDGAGWSPAPTAARTQSASPPVVLAGRSRSVA